MPHVNPHFSSAGYETESISFHAVSRFRTLTPFLVQNTKPVEFSADSGSRVRALTDFFRLQYKAAGINYCCINMPCYMA